MKPINQKNMKKTMTDIPRKNNKENQDNQFVKKQQNTTKSCTGDENCQ